MSNTKEFKVGQVWLNGRGDTIIITDTHYPSTAYPIYGKSSVGGDNYYTQHGCYDVESAAEYLDLITLIKDVETPVTPKSTITSPFKKNSEGTAVVSNEFNFRKITADTPKGARMLLLAKNGLASVDVLRSDNTWFTHWHELPARDKSDE